MNVKMSADYEFPFFSTNMNDREIKLWDELSKFPLIWLISEFDKVLEDGESITDQVRYDVLRGIISDRLGLLHRDIFGPVFAGELNELSDRIKELELKFKNHRHDSSKSFSTKPEW